MTGKEQGPRHVHALVVGIGEVADKMADALDHDLGRISVDIAHDSREALETIDRIVAEDDEAMLTLVIIMDSVGHVDNTIDAIIANPVAAKARFMLMTERSTHDDIAYSIDQNRLTSIMSAPWSATVVTDQVRVEIEKWLFEHRPDRPDIARLVGAPAHESTLGEADLLARLELGSQELVKLLVDRIEAILGPRPRIQLPSGVRLTAQDQPVNAVYLVLDGAVSLHRQTSQGDVLLHHASSGPIIGLVSFAKLRRASFTARTTSASTTVIRLSIQQLEVVLASDPLTSALLAVVTIKALVNRLMRAEALHVENELLATQLEEEKEHLAQALKDLEEARAELVGQARYAMLGELAAGIAHELNNPVAAIIRAADYVSEDVDLLLAGDPHYAMIHTAYDAARKRPSRSTSEERALVKQLNGIVNNRMLAKRLMKAEVDNPDTARYLAQHEDMLRYVEAGAGVGASVRNISIASKRITNLVKSLRSYARPDDRPLPGIDVAETIDETISLLRHRLKDIELEREYHSDLPRITGYAGQLTQVWTNLIVNAAEAMEESGVGGRICIRTETIASPHAPLTRPAMCARSEHAGEAAASQANGAALDGMAPVRSVSHSPQTGQVSIIPSTAQWVRIALWDNGPGVDPKALPQIFEPRFTTKSGTVRFGLGMGLGISRQIVETHGGFIFVDSRPGCTGFVVDLPVDGPPEADDNDRTLLPGSDM